MKRTATSEPPFWPSAAPSSCGQDAAQPAQGQEPRRTLPQNGGCTRRQGSGATTCLALATLATVLLAGCGQPKSSGGIAPPPPSSNPSSQSSANPAERPPAPETPPRTPERLPESAERQEKPMQIPAAGQDGWKPAPKDDIAELGQALDRSILDLEKAYFEVDLIIDNAELKGQNLARGEIYDAKNFKIEYQVPVDPVATTALVSREGNQATLAKGGWTAGISPTPSGTLTTWRDRFPEWIARSMARRTPFWEPFFRQVRESSKDITLEKQQMDVGGKKVSFARVLIKLKDRPATWELRFDTNRNLPVTLRVDDRDSEGKKFLAQWSARWSFSKPIDPKSFDVPADLPKP